MRAQASQISSLSARVWIVGARLGTSELLQWSVMSLMQSCDELCVYQILKIEFEVDYNARRAWNSLMDECNVCSDLWLLVGGLLARPLYSVPRQTCYRYHRGT